LGRAGSISGAARLARKVYLRDWDHEDLHEAGEEMTEWTKNPSELKEGIERVDAERAACCGPCEYDAYCDTCCLRLDYRNALRTLLEHVDESNRASMTRPKKRIPELADCHTTIRVLQLVYDVGQRAWHNDQPLPGSLFLMAASKRIEEMAKEDAECE
jgi:hypothetical protein